MYSFEKDFYEVAITSAVGAVGIASQIPCIILNGYEPINGSIISMGLGTSIGAFMKFPNRYKKWKIFHDTMNSSEYKEEKKLYLEFVKDIANFLKSIGGSSDLCGAYLCKILMDSEMLSEDKVKFTSYKRDYFDHFIDIMGARVTTGAFCCRHAASLVTDVINEMGGVACDVSVNRCEKGSNEKDYANHLITGLEHDKKSVLFDPSVPSYLLTMGGLIEFKTQKGKIVTSDFEDNIVYVEKSSEFDLESINKRNLRRLKKLEPLDVNEEMLGCYLEAFTTYLRHINEIEKFKEKELPKIKRLSKLNKVVTPFSGDEKKIK